ncbi:probable cytochrome P450 6d5 [Contarinia nasturtii]|uniref:probable cytochrome P450 6d5 n=1 Tax=Contarinia nasturtii TaxID=265458 RepID=UPI0012D39575|nr:probable cytochrome P450 6d5 [Contarinia nasturtii]
MGILTDNWKIEALTLVIGILTLSYFYAKRTYSYWERRGIKTFPGFNYIFGHFKPVFSQQESLGSLITRLYNSTKEPFIGIYSILRPILLVRDPELVRTILIKDFPNFTDRGVHCNEGYDPLSAHLFALPGQKWKNLRGKLSPTFTSGKLKAMFSTIVDCGATLQNHLDNLANKNQLLNVHEISASHATNVIASVAFGIDVDTITNPNNDFRVYGRKVFEASISNSIRLSFNFIAPKLMNLLRIKSVSQQVENFIFSIVKQNLEYRENNNVTRKDFFQLLIQLRNTGTVQLDDQWETVIKADESQKSMSLKEIAAQSYVFYIAGFETSSTTLTFCMYELAKHPEIQQRVHNEIDRILEKHNGCINYESVTEMKYLEACIDETLRRYSIVPILNRTCMNDYQIPGTNKIIEKGTEVFIPAYALQMDEQYYEEPTKFKPERFLEEGAKNHVTKPYIAFGDGPRNCIGMRMGKMQTKVGLVLMLQKFKYEMDAKHMGQDMEFDPKLFLLSPRFGVHLRVLKR